eukprot:6444568-Karenia_brevis.AAC.1
MNQRPPDMCMPESKPGVPCTASAFSALMLRCWTEHSIAFFDYVVRHLFVLKAMRAKHNILLRNAKISRF